ncbi:MAG: hypothetical protein QM541_04955 [Flavobacterium sp.]|nr:hypothetical protein [Flavobacterium sp.]
MKYIDKSINETAGKQIVDNLLEHCWIDDQNRYINADYENGLCDNRTTFYKELSEVLLEEQNGLCCYCLKEINEDSTTLEHIIPNKLKLGDFGSYLVTDELRNNVIHKTAFDRSAKVIPPVHYPHDIAYHNLIASCNSKKHCNNYRSDKKIEPFIFDANIETLVEYDRAGNASCVQYDDDLQKLGLSNTNSPLKLIRMIWYKLAQIFNQINEITAEIIDDIIYELILLFDGNRVLENFTNTPSYKEDVLRYKWFFQYYKGA